MNTYANTLTQTYLVKQLVCEHVVCGLGHGEARAHDVEIVQTREHPRVGAEGDTACGLCWVYVHVCVRVCVRLFTGREMFGLHKASRDYRYRNRPDSKACQDRG